MTDERDERRLRDIERRRETGGTVYHGDGTSSQVGSDYGPNHGRATGSDGREYREDFAGNMRRDAGADPIPVPTFRSPSYPTFGGEPIELNLPGSGELKLGIIMVCLVLVGKLWDLCDGWLAAHPFLFLGSLAVLSYQIFRRITGHFRWLYFAVVVLYLGLKVWHWTSGTPA